MAANSSGKVFGTSSDTTSSVRANAKTASVKPSSRVTSAPRQWKPGSPLGRLEIRCLRIIVSGISLEDNLTFASGPNAAQDLRDDGLTELLGQRRVLHQQSEIDGPDHAVDHELRIHLRRDLSRSLTSPDVGNRGRATHAHVLIE